LDEKQRLPQVLLDQGLDFTVESYGGARARDYEHQLNAVSLFGTPAAYDAAPKLSQVIEDSMGDKAYEHEDEYLAAYREVLEAMRPDVAAPPPQEKPRRTGGRFLARRGE
jgi:hypothetical protein